MKTPTFGFVGHYWALNFTKNDIESSFLTVVFHCHRVNPPIFLNSRLKGPFYRSKNEDSRLCLSPLSRFAGPGGGTLSFFGEGHMPRINIEDQFWIDIISVAAQVGDEMKAIGMALKFFRLSQEKFKRGEVMSEAEFLADGFSEALIPKFATRTEKGIEVRGGSKFFQWLADEAEFRKENGRKGGLISAMRPRDDKGHFMPSGVEGVQAESKQNPSGVQANPSDSKRDPSGIQPAWTKVSSNVQASKPSSSSSAFKKEKKINKRKESPKGALPEFSSREQVADKLQDVTHDTQKSWIDVFKDPVWIDACLMDCVLHFQAKGEDTKNWGLRFLNWLKSPYNKRPRTSTPPKVPKGWEGLSDEEIELRMRSV